MLQRFLDIKAHILINNKQMAHKILGPLLYHLPWAFLIIKKAEVARSSKSSHLLPLICLLQVLVRKRQICGSPEDIAGKQHCGDDADGPHVYSLGVTKFVALLVV